MKEGMLDADGMRAAWKREQEASRRGENGEALVEGPRRSMLMYTFYSFFFISILTINPSIFVTTKSFTSQDSPNPTFI